MPPTALIIEDNPDTNDLLAHLVQAWGFEAIQTLKGQDGLELARNRHPDVVLLDLMLPDLNGLDICEELKIDRATNLTPVVMLTALHEHEQMVRGIRVGANNYLPKPFTPDALRSALLDAIERRAQLLNHGTTGEVHFDLRSDTRHLQELNTMLSALLAFTPLEPHQARELIQAVTELGTNAIEWGHRHNTELPVNVIYRIDTEKVTLTIRDQGEGFDRANLPHAAKETDPVGHLDVRAAMGIREGGFGIMLSSGLVDRMEYNERGNEVTVVKYFRDRARAAAAKDIN